MTQTRANKAAQAWRNCLAPGGDLSQDGTVAMSDFAKFCRIGSPPMAVDDHGRADPIKSGYLVGLQEAYNRIEKMIGLSRLQSYGLRVVAWPQETNEDET